MILNGLINYLFLFFDKFECEHLMSRLGLSDTVNEALFKNSSEYSARLPVRSNFC